MKQYCRYCAYFCTGNGNWCSKKKTTMSDTSAKATNRCKSFAFNPIDAFDLDKTYRARVAKKNECDGQINFTETCSKGKA